MQQDRHQKEQLNNEEKEKISVQTIIEVMIRAVFFIIYPALFSTAFTGIKLIVEQITQRASLPWNSFVQTLVVLLVFTIVFGRFFCGFACAFGTWGDFVYFISSMIRKKEKKKPLKCFQKREDTPVFKICCTACCPASLHKRLQQCSCGTQPFQCIFPFPSVKAGRQSYRNRSLFIGYSRNGIGTKIFLPFLMPNGSSIFPDAGSAVFCNQTKQRKLYSKL